MKETQKFGLFYAYEMDQYIRYRVWFPNVLIPCFPNWLGIPFQIIRTRKAFRRRHYSRPKVYESKISFPSNHLELHLTACYDQVSDENGLLTTTMMNCDSLNSTLCARETNDFIVTSSTKLNVSSLLQLVSFDSPISLSKRLELKSAIHIPGNWTVEKWRLAKLSVTTCPIRFCEWWIPVFLRYQIYSRLWRLRSVRLNARPSFRRRPKLNAQNWIVWNANFWT